MMGEIADMMLDGDLCAGCGSFVDISGGAGFPRYCSRRCAEGCGATRPAKRKKRRGQVQIPETPFFKQRRLLELAARPQGVAYSVSMERLEQLFDSGFLRFDPTIDANGQAHFFITDEGRLELARIVQLQQSTREGASS
jgi:hypothetical protein